LGFVKLNPTYINNNFYWLL